MITDQVFKSIYENEPCIIPWRWWGSLLVSGDPVDYTGGVLGQAGSTMQGRLQVR
jgi:hypothetical protein